MSQSEQRFKQQRGLTKEYRRSQRKQIKHWKERASQTPQEKQMQKDLRAIMLADFKTNNPERKFRFEHIEQLIEKHQLHPYPNAVLCYGKKNIGKTGALARKLREMHLRDPNAQFIFIRNQEQDSIAVENMMQDDIGPIYMSAQEKKFYWKDDEFAFISMSKEKKKKVKQRVAGGFVWMSGGGTQRVQGSAYENVRLIIWDECNDTDGNKLTPEALHRLYILSSSIVRGKELVETYMMGNLLSKQDESMNIFLSRLNVNPEVRLKIIDSHKDNDPRKPVMSRLLYLNLLDDYVGIENQRSLLSQFTTEREQDALLKNIPKSMITKCTYSAYSFIKLAPLFCLCFRLRAPQRSWKTYILYMAKVQEKTEFVMWIDEFDPLRIKLGYDLPITNDRAIVGVHVAPFYVKDNKFFRYIKIIGSILQSGQLGFGYNNTLITFWEIGVKGEPLIDSYRKANKII